MTVTTRNTIATLVASALGALIQLASIRIYFRMLGSELYGIYSFWVLISSIVQILDFGMSPKIMRIMVRNIDLTLQRANLRKIFASELGKYLLIGTIPALLLMFTAASLSTRWLNLTQVTSSEATQILKVGALLIFVQWPLSWLNACLAGMRRQVLASTIQIASAILKHGVGILLVSATPGALLSLVSWYILVSAVQAVIMGVIIYSRLPICDDAHMMQVAQQKNDSDFAFGMFLHALLGTAALYSTSIVLSRGLPVQELANYSIAQALASALMLLSSPVNSVMFARLSLLATRNQEKELVQSFYVFSEFIMVLLIPIAATLIGYLPNITNLWLQDTHAATQVASISRLLIVANTINSLSSLLYFLQISQGKTLPGIVSNLLLLSIQVPCSFIAIQYWQAWGAAIVMVFIFSGHLIFNLGMAWHMQGLQLVRNWLIRDVLVITAVVILTATIFYLIGDGEAFGIWFLWSIITAMACFLAATITSARLNIIVRSHLMRFMQIIRVGR